MRSSSLFVLRPIAGTRVWLVLLGFLLLFTLPVLAQVYSGSLSGAVSYTHLVSVSIFSKSRIGRSMTRARLLPCFVSFLSIRRPSSVLPMLHQWIDQQNRESGSSKTDELGALSQQGCQLKRRRQPVSYTHLARRQTSHGTVAAARGRSSRRAR